MSCNWKLTPILPHLNWFFFLPNWFSLNRFCALPILEDITTLLQTVLSAIKKDRVVYLSSLSYNYYLSTTTIFHKLVSQVLYSNFIITIVIIIVISRTTIFRCYCCLVQPSIYKLVSWVTTTLSAFHNYSSVFVRVPPSLQDFTALP